MQLQNFTAQRFRNLADLDWRPASEMNVIYGENAQGKTNLLEGIYLLSTLRSFRTRHLPEALQFGKPDALLQGAVLNEQSSHSLALSFTETGKTALLDRKKVDPVHYLSTFDVFLFSYPLLEVIRGGPEERRRFLDRSIAVSKPGYLSQLLQYYRALRQKNSLLAALQRGQVSRKEGVDEVRSFNDQICKRGIEIARLRFDYLSLLRDLLREKQSMFFTGEVTLGAELQSSFQNAEQKIMENLDRVLEKEILRGFSLIGIHRDDVVLTLDGKELRKFGSSGQHRAFLLLMLLAQVELYERWRGEHPVLLLDDLDSELDRGRIQTFLEMIEGRYQTFISSSRRELFSKNGKVCLHRIESGRLLENGGVQ